MARSVLKKSYYDLRKITADQIAAYAAPLAAPGREHALLETGKQIIPPDIDELTYPVQRNQCADSDHLGKAGQNHFAPGRRAFIPSYSEFDFEVDRSMRARAAGRDAGSNGSPGAGFFAERVAGSSNSSDPPTDANQGKFLAARIIDTLSSSSTSSLFPRCRSHNPWHRRSNNSSVTQETDPFEAASNHSRAGWDFAYRSL